MYCVICVHMRVCVYVCTYIHVSSHDLKVNFIIFESWLMNS